MIRQWFYALLLAAGCSASGVVGAADAGSSGNRNVLEKLAVATSGDQVTVRMTFRDALGAVPPGFTTASPARVALDLVGVDSGLERNSQAINQAYLRTVNLAQAGDRLRVVLNLDRAATYETKRDGRDLFVTLLAVSPSDPAKDGAAGQFAPPPSIARGGANISDVSFRRGKDGEGRILVDLDDASVGVDIQKQGGNVVVEFTGAKLPENLARKLDVNDFSTPVSSIVTAAVGDKVRMTVSPHGKWEHIAYQTDNQFVLEIRPVVEDPNKLGGGVKRYQGDRLSLRFRDYPVKEVLHAFSDFSGFNIIVSESVSGVISLNLVDVPWDQALDIILQQKHLAMAKNGNVMMIASREEILARNKVTAEAATVEPPVDAVFQVNYIPAVTAKTRVTEYLNLNLDKDKDKSSTSVKVMAEPQTNKLFVKAPESVLEDLRKMLREIDLPPRQVLIEARIVEANETFSRNLGVRFGYSDLNGTGSFAQDSLTAGGQKLPITKPNNILGGDNTTLQGNVVGNVNLPSGATNKLSFFLTNRALTRVLALELSASEADKKIKNISSPRVLSQNGQAAKIDVGRQIAITTTTNNVINTTLIDATLALSVTPTINADGRVNMDLKVTNDTIIGRLPVELGKQSVSTKVVVDNGGTVVIGGIYTETDSRQEDRVPFFGDLPYVGFLFKNKVKATERNEILVFITPRIVSDQLTLQ